MTATIENVGSFVQEFGRFQAVQDTGAWPGTMRREAIDRFSEAGVPTTRHEEWRFTNVSAIARTPFRLAGPAKVTLAELQPHLVPDAHRLVFVNGRFARELSDLGAPQSGLSLGSIADAIQSRSDAIREHLGQYAPQEGQAFTALNTAFLEDGALVQIPRGLIVARPIHLVFVSTGGSEPLASHPRVLVLAGEATQACIVETYIGSGPGYFTNAVTEIIAGENAVVQHYRVQREHETAFHIATQYFRQARSSNVTSLSISLGAALARTNVHTVLDGEGCESTLNGLYMAGGRQHVDNHLRVEHAKPHCHSWEYYKGILDGEARGVFTGRIVVHKDAQKTDAKQTNMNLLLSQNAQIDTKPQLEIFADDVKCTHGATIGQIDSEALFYLRARGVSEQTARSMLIFAFANETLEQIRVDSLRDQITGVLFDRLPGGKRLREAL